jgi:hypothetical protein
MIAPFIRQDTLMLSGNPGDPLSYSRARLRPRAQGGDTSVLRTLDIDTDGGGSRLGTFDLADTALLINYTDASPVQEIRAHLRSGFAGGSWTGAGLTSSTAAADPRLALGYAEASELLGAAGGEWEGQSADATTLLIRLVVSGDANLDGAVGFADLVRLAQNYNTTTGDSIWTRGDFTYDGIVNFADLVKLAQNYGTALPASAVPGAAADFSADWSRALAQVPEPTTLSFAFLASSWLSGRRARRRSGSPS